MDRLIDYISRKPHMGCLASSTGFFAWFLEHLGILTPIMSFAGATLGVIAGAITVAIKIRDWLRGKTDKPS